MDESRILIDIIGATWPDAPGPEVAAIEPALIDALRELDATAPEHAERVRNRVLGVLDGAPVLHAQVVSAIGATLLGSERGVESTTPAVAAAVRRSEVAIAYATDRLETGKMNAEQRYGPDRGDALRFGRAWVELPDDYRMGRLPRPRHWPLRFARRGRAGCRLAESASLTDSVAEMRDRAPGPDVLVFVHGYNVAFIDAARRTAQLAYDLDFTGVPVLYSWPSAGATAAYLVDGENAAATQRRFRGFLQSLIAVTDGGRVHIIAHSMGNRILTEALSTLSMYRLGHVVFAAPDVDAQLFADRAAEFSGTAARYTLYASDRDRALAASRGLAKAPRAGSAGPGIVVVDGIDTIDASALDTGLMSHSYPMEHRSIVADIYSLLRHNLPPGQRFGLRPTMSASGHYWVFCP